MKFQNIHMKISPKLLNKTQLPNLPNSLISWKKLTMIEAIFQNQSILAFTILIQQLLIQGIKIKIKKTQSISRSSIIALALLLQLIV